MRVNVNVNVNGDVVGCGGWNFVIVWFCGGMKVIKNGGLRSGREDLQEEIRDGLGDWPRPSLFW